MSTKMAFLFLFIISLVMGCKSLQFETKADFDRWQQDYDRHIIDGDTCSMIELRGFQCDNFTVAVDYHYMVRVYRILNPVRRARPGYSILMLSGIGFNSDQFLLPGTGYLDNISGEYVEFDYNRGGRKVRIECEGEPPQVGRNLAFTLSACGYDVWLGNFRDSLPKDAFNWKVSRDSEDYWRISIDQYSEDAHKIIDTILTQTNSTTLGVVCHSLGCATIFQLLAVEERFNSQIRPFISLGPYLYAGHSKSVAVTVASSVESLTRHIRAPLPNMRLISKQLGLMSTTNGVLRTVIAAVYWAIQGFSHSQIDYRFLARVTANYPMNFALQVYAHFAQRSINAKALTMFDFGLDGNQQNYGQPHPPVYQLKRVTNKFMVFFTGAKDTLADRVDIERARTQLAAPLWHDIYLENFGHLDLIFGRDADKYVIAPIIRILRTI